MYDVTVEHDVVATGYGFSDTIGLFADYKHMTEVEADVRSSKYRRAEQVAKKQRDFHVQSIVRLAFRDARLRAAHGISIDRHASPTRRRWL